MRILPGIVVVARRMGSVVEVLDKGDDFLPRRGLGVRNEAETYESLVSF